MLTVFVCLLRNRALGWTQGQVSGRRFPLARLQDTEWKTHRQLGEAVEEEIEIEKERHRVVASSIRRPSTFTPGSNESLYAAA